ncbi:hypothetical protein EG68_11724, partial [Paragonimus skrjabini miyazakii]
VNKARLEETSIWVQIDESQLISESFVKRLHRRFRIKENRRLTIGGAESAVTSTFSSSGLERYLDRVKLKSDAEGCLISNKSSAIAFNRAGSKRFGFQCHTLDLMPPKIAQSVAIAMASAHLEPVRLAHCIIELQTEMIPDRMKSVLPSSLSNDNSESQYENNLHTQRFPETLIETLISNLPPMDRMLKLSDRPLDHSALIESDQLMYFLAPLRHRLPAHLNAMRTLLCFNTTTEQLKLALRTCCSCLSEIKHAQSIPHLLSCALALVNALNATGHAPVKIANQANEGVHPVGHGYMRRPLIGFQVRNLVRLADTKDSSNERTLVDYLAELMELK